MRYNTDGSLDTSFSGDGMLTTDLGDSDYGYSLSLQADGKILLGGTSNGNFALVRYNTDGSLDTGFSGDGMLTTDLGGNDSGNSLSLQADGKILLGCTSNDNFALVRYNTDGSLDTSFSGDGKLTTNLGDFDHGNSLSLQADGKILLGGTGNGDFALVRYNTDGSVDTSFGNPTGSLAITGTATQGQVLSVTNAVIDTNGINYLRYQWLADGQVISGATGSTLALNQAQVGKAISVQMDYTDGRGLNKSLLSAATQAVANINDAPTGDVTISGTATQNQTLTAISTLADTDGLGTLAYQWLADGVAINGATASTFNLGQAQVGKAISVQASYTDAFGIAESVTSAATLAVTNVNDAPTGSLTITGTATQNQTLTATSTLADVDGLGTVAYQWLADGVAINGATSSTFTLGQAQVGKAISVKASYTDGQNTAESVTSAATLAVTNINDAPTGSLTISGTATQNQTLTAISTLADVDGLGTLAYQWLADGVAINGATSSTFTLGQAQVGKAISVQASYTDGFGMAESVTSVATRTVANINDAPTGGVSISGTAAQNQTLTAISTLANDADGMGTISYQWLANGQAITGATGETLTLAQAQVGKAISVQASYTDGQNTAESVTSTATLAVTNLNDASTGNLTISGTATQNQTLTAISTLADADGLGTLAYQWLADGVAINGATSSTFTLGQAQVGKAISVKASYTDGQNTAESVTSAATLAVTNVNDAPTGSLTITGTATQNQTLTATSTLADVDGLGTLAYQWLADGVAISGATASTFTLGQAQVGKAISVKASYTDAFGMAESVTSVATRTVANINDAPTGGVSISGTAAQNQTLTAISTLANDADGMGTISYQWLANGQAITGATGETLTLTQAQVGKAISVKASYTDGQNTLETVTSAATAVVQNVNDAPTGSITISGTATQNQTLTAISTLADADGLRTLAYQWLADGVAISGATARSYVLTQAQVGKAISVKASYVDGQGTAESVTSAVTEAVRNINDAPIGSVTINGLIQGDALIGHQLTAINSLADADGLGTFTYQWLADGVAIRGATAETFIPTVSQQEKAISVKVQYTDGFGKKETVQSAVVATAQDAQYGDLIRVGSNDRLQGGIFTSDLYGYAGNDELRGDAGEDRLYGGYGDDSLYGGIGNDELEGDQGNDKLYGELGNDVLTGGTGRDSLYGGDGNDVLDGSSDRDFMDGGNGRDTYYVDNPGDVVRDSGTDNVKDVLYITAYLQSGYSLGEGIENAILSGEANASSLTGNASSNTLTGNTSENKLSGGVGIDTLNGGDGNDTLMGGEGKDVLNGGAGRDVFKLEKLIESGVTTVNRDVISDFTRGQDKIGLSALDANTQIAGDQAFTAFITSAQTFTAAGQLQLKNGVLYGNTDADADAEFSIALTGITTLTMADVVA